MSAYHRSGGGGVRDMRSLHEFRGAVSGSRLVVIDFYATWCGPCQMAAPKFKDMAARYPNASFYRVNVDECREISQACSVTAMPTFQLYKGDRLLKTVVGVNLEELESAVRNHITPLSSSAPGRVLGGPDAGSSSATAANRVRRDTTTTTTTSSSSSSSSPSSSKAKNAAGRCLGDSNTTGAVGRGVVECIAGSVRESPLVWLLVVGLVAYWYTKVYLPDRQASRYHDVFDS